MKYQGLFEPINIGKLEIKNRVEIQGMREMNERDAFCKFIDKHPESVQIRKLSFYPKRISL